MNEHLSNILSSLSDRSRPIAEADVLALAEEYPFFTLPTVMLMRQEADRLSPEVLSRLRELVALNAPDARTLALVADPSCEDWVNFYPVEERSITTDSVIDTFLNTYGHTSPKEEELLERLIFNPAPDYSTILAREEEESLPETVDPADNSQDALINAFILEQRGATPVHKPEPEKPDGAAEPQSEHPRAAAAEDNSSLTESLAKIYIRQKRYDKAFEIIHTLSLKNPKKSAYFADQLRFLRKLMLVQKHRER